MQTEGNKNLLVVGAVLIVSVIVIGFAGSIQGGERSYKIRPEITLPEYRTDTARAIDAYERMMDRFISLTERNLTGINTDVKSIAQELALIDYRLTELSAGMARIEKALGIVQPEKRVEQSSKVETSNNTNKTGSESRK